MVAGLKAQGNATKGRLDSGPPLVVCVRPWGRSSWVFPGLLVEGGILFNFHHV